MHSLKDSCCRIARIRPTRRWKQEGWCCRQLQKKLSQTVGIHYILCRRHHPSACSRRGPIYQSPQTV